MVSKTVYIFEELFTVVTSKWFFVTVGLSVFRQVTICFEGFGTDVAIKGLLHLIIARGKGIVIYKDVRLHMHKSNSNDNSSQYDSSSKLKFTEFKTK